MPTGIDLSPEMVVKATELFPDVHFSVDNFMNLNHDECSVAGVLAFYCIVHLQPEQLLPAFTEMHRVLKPDGVLLLSFHVGTETIHVDSFLNTSAELDFRLFSMDEILTNLQTAGFTDIKIHEREPYESEHPTKRCYIFAQRTNED